LYGCFPFLEFRIHPPWLCVDLPIRFTFSSWKFLFSSSDLRLPPFRLSPMFCLDRILLPCFCFFETAKGSSPLLADFSLCYTFSFCLPRCFFLSPTLNVQVFFSPNGSTGENCSPRARATESVPFLSTSDGSLHPPSRFAGPMRCPFFLLSIFLQLPFVDVREPSPSHRAFPNRSPNNNKRLVSRFFLVLAEFFLYSFPS